MRREKSLRIGVHHADAVVWEPVYRTHLRRGGDGGGGGGRRRRARRRAAPRASRGGGGGERDLRGPPRAGRAGADRHRALQARAAAGDGRRGRGERAERVSVDFPRNERDFAVDARGLVRARAVVVPRRDVRYRAYRTLQRPRLSAQVAVVAACARGRWRALRERVSRRRGGRASGGPPTKRESGREKKKRAAPRRATRKNRTEPYVFHRPLVVQGREVQQAVERSRAAVAAAFLAARRGVGHRAVAAVGVSVSARERSRGRRCSRRRREKIIFSEAPRRDLLNYSLFSLGTTARARPPRCRATTAAATRRPRPMPCARSSRSTSGSSRPSRASSRDSRRRGAFRGSRRRNRNRPSRRRRIADDA